MSCVLRLTRDKDLLSEIQAAGLEASTPISNMSGGVVNVSISEADFSDLVTQVADAIQFLTKHGSLLRTLRVSGSLDFGVTARDVPAQSHRFPAELIRLAGELGIGIEVSIYQVASE